MSRQTRWNNSI